MSARSDRLGDIAREANAAVGNERDARLLERHSDVLYGGDLRDADAGDDARRADRPRSDSDLDAVGPLIDERLGALGSGDVAADHFRGAGIALDPAQPVEHALRMPVRGIDDDDVHPGFDQGSEALFRPIADSDRRADPELAMLVLRRVRVLARLENVLDRDQAAQLEAVAHDQHALQTMLVQELARLLRACAFLDVHQPIARGHDGAHRLVEVGLETVVAVRDHADDLALLDDRKSRHPVLLREREELADRDLGCHRHRIAEHPGFVALDLGDLRGLLLGGEILVDDADAALLRDGDRERRLGDRIHRRRDERDVELDVARQPGLEADIARQDAGVGRYEKDVVKGESLLDWTHCHTQKSDYTPVASARKFLDLACALRLTGALKIAKVRLTRSRENPS